MNRCIQEKLNQVCKKIQIDLTMIMRDYYGTYADVINVRARALEDLTSCSYKILTRVYDRTKTYETAVMLDPKGLSSDESVLDSLLEQVVSYIKKYTFEEIIKADVFGPAKDLGE